MRGVDGRRCDDDGKEGEAMQMNCAAAAAAAAALFKSLFCVF